MGKVKMPAYQICMIFAQPDVESVFEEENKNQRCRQSLKTS
jgi:hypothetical protein